MRDTSYLDNQPAKVCSYMYVARTRKLKAGNHTLHDQTTEYLWPSTSLKPPIPSCLDIDIDNRDTLRVSIIYDIELDMSRQCLYINPLTPVRVLSKSYLGSP